MTIWQAGRYQLNLQAPCVMGIVNVTPDSFSDGGAYGTTASAIQHCEQLINEGADILDLGAESSRPGAQPLPVDVELNRLLPVLKVAVTLGVPVSVDTYKAEVMCRVLDLGADIINDIQALTGVGALTCVAAHPSCGICLMHMRGRPVSMQCQVSYEDVVVEVCDFLAQRADCVVQAGVVPERIVLDPGVGFGKSVEHNLALFAGQGTLATLGYPVLAGWSRKSTLGVLTGRDVSDRLIPSVAAALAAVVYGARVLRVHDVAATVDALKVWLAAGLCDKG